MESKKNIRRRILPMLLLSMLMAMLFGISAMAAVVDMQKQSNGAYLYVTTSGSNSGDVYHRIKIPSSGRLSISGKVGYSFGEGSIGFEVCNSSGKELTYYTSTNANNGEYASYGVKAGTYYIKTKAHARYAIAASFQKLTDKGGTKKSKAYNLKKKANVYGVMPIGEKQSAADWYKIKLKKGQILNLEVVTSAGGYLDYRVYGPNFSKGRFITSQKEKGERVQLYLKKGRKKYKLKAGTYYIKVSRSSGGANGIYRLRWY